MKLALYLPNFGDMVTVKELEELTSLAEELDFDTALPLLIMLDTTVRPSR
jgi:dimethylsulfone monooxygenase